MQVEPGLHPLQHSLGRADRCLPDRSSRLDFDDHAVIRVDQVVVGINEECRSLARCRLPAGRVLMRGKFGLDLGRGTEGCFIQCVETLAHGTWCIGRVDA